MQAKLDGDAAGVDGDADRGQRTLADVVGVAPSHSPSNSVYSPLIAVSQFVPAHPSMTSPTHWSGGGEQLADPFSEDGSSGGHARQTDEPVAPSVGLYSFAPHGVHDSVAHGTHVQEPPSTAGSLPAWQACGDSMTMSLAVKASPQ